MNRKFNCKDYQLKICKETENIFNADFWERQDMIISGVDDNKARMYLNDQCFKYNKILLNIGTSGVRAKADVIIPKKTYPLAIILNESEISVNVCTLKSFPFKIEHCIQWSKDIFYSFFQKNIKIYNSFISDGNKFISDLAKEPKDVMNEKYMIVDIFSDILINEDNREQNYKIIDLCIYYFYDLFVDSIEALLRKYSVKENCDLFWSGSKKKPSSFKSLDIKDEMMYQFLYCFNFILCQCMDIQFNEGIFNEKNFSNFVKEKFEKHKNEKEIENVNVDEIILRLNEINTNINKFKKPKYKLSEIVFEKDGLNNNHLEFIQACSNLRARNYNIQEENKNKILMIAGKIIASVPTSTASIVGYISLQIINLLYTHDTKNVVKNVFMNLGLNTMDLIPQEQIEQKNEEEGKKKKEEEITKYPKIRVQGSKTCSEFLKYLKDNYNYEIFHFEINDKIIYDKRNTKDPRIIKREIERSQKKVEDLYFEQIKRTKEEIDFNLKNLNIKVNCRIRNDQNEIIENIYDLPLIDYVFK